MRGVLFALGFTALLGGCASSLGTFYNRPVVEDNVADVLSTVSLSADRRTVVVVHPIATGPGAQSKPQYPKFCAEPPPDTASGMKTDLDANLKYKGDEASLKDKFETTVTVLSARNAPLDAFRTGVFTLCQFYLIGAIQEKDVGEYFGKLMTMYENTQGKIPVIVETLTAPAKAAAKTDK